MTKPQIPNPKSRLVIGHWSLAIALLLLAWGLRLCCLETVGPGWRDDELINIHALSGEVLAGRFPLYFTEASGHEPMYHYLHAGVHALLGFNVLSGHLLSVVFGTLTIALTYVLAQRMFGRGTAMITSLALTFSFWSLMYSRTAIRHVNLPPFALAAFYVLWRTFDKSQILNLKSQIGRSILLGLVVGASLYIYPAARLIPGLLIIFAVYLALFHRERFRRHWRGLLLALAVTAVVAIPLGAAIARITGVDARIAELAVPVRELRAGNPRPLIENVWTTLGMFHATGDPEWLYNIPDRPVFNWLGGALLWVGVALCLYRWRRPRYFFLLAWLGAGLLPAFVSTPPASLSHTILAQPVTYMLPALALTEAYGAVKSQIPNLKSQVSNLGRCTALVARWVLVAVIGVFLASNAIRDVRDYFVTWPERGMVRFLYRADYRDVARYLNEHAEVKDVSVSSTLMGPWDRLAVAVDTRRDDVGVRFFNPERALVWPAGETPAVLLLTSSPDPAPPIDAFLEANGDLPAAASRHIKLYTVKRGRDFAGGTPLARFANGLELLGAGWIDEASLAPGQEATLLTTWRVSGPLDLPPIPIIANPPPPDVYAGSRVSIFAHLLTLDETSFVVDDGLWLDPLTLQPGDCFLQIHRFALPPDMPAGPYLLELGGYDPMTGDRWPTLPADGQPGSDRFSRLVGVAPSVDLGSEAEEGERE
jgi:hypothetical protein